MRNIKYRAWGIKQKRMFDVSYKDALFHEDYFNIAKERIENHGDK